MHCYYDNKAKKQLISDGYTLAIYKKKYNKIYLYPLITLSLNHLLDKEFILKELSPQKQFKITESVNKAIQTIYLFFFKSCTIIS